MSTGASCPHAVSVLLLLALAGCDPTKADDTGADRFHPAGWSASDQHGQAAKYQELDCVACHGAGLDGGTAEQGCDTCHAAGWRTDCTFCHGGTDDTSGAPPRDIDGLETDLAFPEHTAHVAGGDHPAWSCDRCHATPTDVLSAGHLFVDDASAGLAEVAFTDGLSADGVYGATCSNLYCHGDGVALGDAASGEVLDCGGCHGSAEVPGTLSGGHPAHLSASITCGESSTGTCSNLYCHGDGDGTLGTVSTGATTTCGSCHGSASGSSSWNQLSGEHAKHMRDASAECGDCHATTVSGDSTIVDPALHVNGATDTSFTSGIVWDGTRCSGSCHSRNHGSEDRW